MNSIANGISLTRLVLAPLLAACIVGEYWTAAFVAFVIGAVSDFYDGRIARDQNTVSRLGGLLDHTADCVFVACALAALGYLEIVPWYLSPLVVVAFVQYVVDSGVFKKRELVASRLGKWNGIAYFVLVGIPITQNALSLDWITDKFVYTAGGAMCVLTLVSIFERIMRLVQSRDGRR